jgi:hypothetical protein
MSKILLSGLFAGALFGGVLICLRIGWRLGRQRLKEEGDNGHAGLGAVEGAVYGLMGLLIAFTFTGAASRFDARRQLIAQEVNAIGTAWLRLDLLPAENQDRLRPLFRRYLDAQIDLPRHATDPEGLRTALAHRNALQEEIWNHAIAALQTDPSPALKPLVLSPINEMFDLAATRFMASRLHPPPAIFAMLGLLILVSGLMAGFGMARARRQSWVHVLGFASIVAVSAYLILDLEYPRLGLIRVDAFDQAFVELRATMD